MDTSYNLADADRLDESPTHSLRKGKWTNEEENYANKIIYYFNQGRLNIPPGTTLRTFLSDKLQCDPMRITKKYAGSSSIGKQLFQPCDNFHDVQDQIRGIETELARLEIIFLAKIHSKLPSSDKLALTPEPPLRKGVNSSPGALDQTDQEDSGSNGSHPKLRLLNFEALSDGKMKPKLIGPHTSMNISGSILMDKSKRTLSAPNLQHLVPIKDKSAVLSMPLASSSSTKDDQSVLKPNYSSSKKTIGWKRSRSVMALMDFEKLVADDQAAGDLFYEFINTVHLNKIRAKPDTIGEIKPPSTFGVSSVAPFGGPSIIHSKRETQSNEHNDTHDNNDNSNEEQLVIQDARINEQLNSTNLDDGFGEDAEDNFF